MKKKHWAALLAAAMLTGLASATFAANEDVTDTRDQIETVTIEAEPEIKAGAQVTLNAFVSGTKWNVDTRVPLTNNDVTFTWKLVNGDKLDGIELKGATLSVLNTTTTKEFQVSVTATTENGGLKTVEHQFTVTGAQVPKPYATKIEITGTPDKVTPGSEFTLKAVATMSQESASYDGPWTWTLKEVEPANEGVTIDQTGKVTIASSVPAGTMVQIVVEGSGLKGISAPEGVQAWSTAATSFEVEAATTGGSTGGSTSGGSSSSGGTTTTTPVEETVSTTEAVAKVEQAIAAADADATVVVVRIRNAKSITVAALKAVLKAAVKAEKAPIVHADVTKDGKVESRLYIDPSLMKGNGEIKLGVTLGDEKVTTKFDQYFKNDIAVVKFDQTGSFGMSIKAAVKLDLSKLDTKALVFYSYNPKTNTYTKMTAPNYRIDANGYLHFTTSMGNCVIVTDQPLARK